MNKKAPVSPLCGLTLALILLGIAAQAGAQPAHLVKNINTARDMWGRSTDPHEAIEVSGVVYFVGSDSSSGPELWRTDGTPGGTRLVKDILPGRDDSSGYGRPRNLVNFGGTLFFVATGGLWKSDGTTAGTVEVVSFDVDGSYREVTQVTPAEGALFFMVGADLWKTDGSAPGTSLVRSFAGTRVRQLVAVKGRVFAFLGEQPTDLWVSDGTPDGTRRVHEACTTYCGDESSAPLQVSAVDGTLFFAGGDPESGVELWKSDGTEEGTGIVFDILPGPDGSSPNYLVNAAGSLFFSAKDESGARSLWVKDAASAIPRKVSNVPAHGISSVGGRVFFIGFEADTGREPWVSDGTEDGTHLVSDLCPGPCSSMDSLPWWGREFRDSAGFAFFVGGSPYFRDLWRTDATAEGTVRVGTFSYGLQPLVGAGSREFYFVAAGEFWATDGSPGEAVQLTTGVGEGGSNPSYLTAVNEGIYFDALERWAEGGFGYAGWHSTGEEAGTVRQSEPWVSGEAVGLAAVAGRLLFSADGLWTVESPGRPAVRLTNRRYWQLAASNDLAFFGVDDQLWRTDGTAAGTRMVRETGLAPLADFTFARGLVFFTSASWLWRSDGTREGTFSLQQAASFQTLFAFKGHLYFSTGSALWKTDGTLQGTAVVIPDLGGLLTPTVSGNRFFFVRWDLEGGYEPWVSDGTPQGTRRVKDIRPGPIGSVPSWPVGSWFINLRGTLYFTADDGAHGRELWRSDGTEEGTVMVKDILPGAGSSVPSDLANVYGTLYLTASDGLSGREVWRSDGTAEGTHVVQDISPGPGSSNPASFTPAGRQLFFRADDGETGSEVWAVEVTTHDIALLTGPSPGSTLTGTTASFTWEAGGEALEYWLTVKNPTSGKLIYSASEGTGLRRTVSGLPFDGSRIVVRLWSRLPSGWEVLDYSYDAAAPTLAEVTAPVPGTTLTSSVTTFSWSPGVAVSAYWLQVGTSLGGRQIYNGSSVTTRLATVSGLPIDGAPVYVRLWSLVDTAWQFRDFTYTSVTAVTEKARMITPPPDSVLPGSTVTFTWDPGSGVAAYWLDIGTTPAGMQISRGSRVTALSATVARIPTNGAPVYARLWSEIGGRWSYNDYAYRAFSSIGLAVSAVTLPPGQPVQVIVQGSPGNPRDWVGLYRSDAPESAYLDWQYLSGTRVPPVAGINSARLTFTMPAVAGTYEFRLFANGGFARLATSTRVTVETVVPALRVAELTVGPGQAAHVTLENGPGNRTDWVGLFALGAADTGYFSWQYLNGTRTAPAVGLTTATLSFETPTAPGAYEFRLFENNTYARLATSPIIAVE